MLYLDISKSCIDAVASLPHFVLVSTNRSVIIEKLFTLSVEVFDSVLVCRNVLIKQFMLSVTKYSLFILIGGQRDQIITRYQLV